MPIPFVGKRFKPGEFAAHLEQVSFDAFVPTFATLHHTASPSLAMRPAGLSDQHLQNLLDYYQGSLGWSGAPHLFIDDRTDGIIVFQRLDRKGVHAVSFNRNSWGMEMLGDYDCEPFDSGRGAHVRDNAMQALAAICKRLSVPADSIRFHRDDPKTSKSCPGRLVTKQDVVARVSALLSTGAPADSSAEPGWPEWCVELPGGVAHEPVHVKDGRPIVRVRTFLNAVAPGGAFQLSSDQTTVRWTDTAGKGHDLPVAELDEAGAAWCLVRLLAEAAGRSLTVSGRTVQIG